jgi:RND family efflux transporter MFP subunit
MRACVLAVSMAGVLACVAGLGGCKRPPAQFVPPPPPKVTVARPERRVVPMTLVATGTTRSADEVSVRARVRGFVERKLVQGGEMVKAGDLLFVIDQREYQAKVMEREAELASKQAALALSQITLERTKQVRESGAATDLEVKQAMAGRDQAGAAVELADANLMAAKLDLEFCEVRAPIAGRVAMQTPDLGQLVGSGEPTLLTTIRSENPIYVRYNIEEQELLQLRRAFQNKRPGEDGRPTVVVRLGLAGEEGYPHTGRFNKADNTVDPQTGTLALEAVFDNEDRALLPGLFARVEAILGEEEQWTLPDLAVQSDQAGRFVLVVNEANEVSRREVTVGRVIDRRRVILGGLKGDEWVIINGLQRAADKAKVDPVRTDTGKTPTGGAPAAEGAGGRGGMNAGKADGKPEGAAGQGGGEGSKAGGK